MPRSGARNLPHSPKVGRYIRSIAEHNSKIGKKHDLGRTGQQKSPALNLKTNTRY